MNVGQGKQPDGGYDPYRSAISTGPYQAADDAFNKEHEPMSIRTMLGRGVKNPKPVTLEDILRAHGHLPVPVDRQNLTNGETK